METKQIDHVVRAAVEPAVAKLGPAASKVAPTAAKLAPIVGEAVATKVRPRSGARRRRRIPDAARFPLRVAIVSGVGLAIALVAWRALQRRRASAEPARAIEGSGEPVPARREPPAVAGTG